MIPKPKMRKHHIHQKKKTGRWRAEFIPWVPDYSAVVERLGLAVVSADFNVRPVGQLVQVRGGGGGGGVYGGVHGGVYGGGGGVYGGGGGGNREVDIEGRN